MKHTILFIIQTVRSLITLFAFLVLTPPDGGKAQNNFVAGDQMPIDNTSTHWRYFPENTTINVSPTGDGYINNIIKETDNWTPSEWAHAGDDNVTITINRTDAEKALSVLVVKYGTNYPPASTVTIEWEGNRQIFTNEIYANTVYLRLKEPITSNTIKLTFKPAFGGIQLNKIFSLPSIQHKAAKWHGMRDGNKTYGDTFDKDNSFFELSGDDYVGRRVQATHVMTDTIYMRRGTKVNLTLPNKLDDNKLDQNSMNSYIRWYSYRTGTTYLTEHRRTQDGEGYDNRGVYDLLTPANSNEGAAEAITRFDNGYLLLPFTTKSLFAGMNFYFPTDDEFKAWFPSFANSSKIDNKSYVVACDVSQYTDYGDETTTEGQPADKFKASDYCEPTLTHRIIYYIKAVEEEEPPYEEYTINMPATRVRSHTTELVTLSKMARNYLSQSGTEAEATLVATIDPTDNSADIELCNQHDYNGGELTQLILTGTNRNITFRYPRENPDGTRTVIPQPDNDQPLTATIVVKPKNSDKVVARFHLNFVRGGRLLTQSMVKLLDGETVNGEKLEDYSTTQWATLGYRTPKKIDKDPNNEVLTELTMDYDKSEDIESEDHISGYYPYPLAWISSSYGFYDGTKEGQGFNGNKNCAEWGNYAITTKYVECAGEGGWGTSEIVEPKTDGKYDPKGYHLFIDASDRPGTIFRAPFRKKLCSNAQLTFSAWVKVAREGGADNAGMLLTIMGKTVDEKGNDKYVPVYRYLTGQIPATYVASAQLPGFSTEPQSNEWLHVYFTFMNGNIDYEDYYLQVDNYSASTAGADMYLDDVRVYMAKPKAHVKQKKISCGTSTLMTLSLDWTTLLKRIGKAELTGDASETSSIDFCFVDSIDYVNAYNKKENVQEAIEASWMPIKEDNSLRVGTLSFDLNFEKNKVYDEDKDKENLVLQDNNNQFYQTGEGDARSLIGDLYSSLKQNRRYMILIREKSTGQADASGFEDPREVCSISTSFSVESQNQVLINGEVLDPLKTQEYCTGQAIELSMRLRVPKLDENKDPVYDSDGNQVFVGYEHASEVYYDWYFNSSEDFELPQTSDEGNTLFNGVTLKEALSELRANYPEASVIEDPNAAEGERFKLDPEAAITTDGSFTQDHINLINYKLNQKGRDDAVNRKLILRRKTLDVRLLDDEGRTLKICPIQQETQDGLFCAEPVDLHMTPGGKAPSVQPGFEYMKYLEDTHNPAMRIGLKHIISSTESNPITVNLRNIRFALKEGDEGYDENYKPDHVGLMRSQEGTNYNDIYLIGSTDPAYKELFDDPNFDKYTYIIGKVISFFAQPRYEGDEITGTNIMKIFFSEDEVMTEGDTGLKFNPKEGYEYTFMVRYEEYHTPTTRAADDEGGNETDTFTPCYGNFIMTMKVVPEYLVWQGKTIGINWNNDSQWKRATYSDIKAEENTTIPVYKGDEYAANPGYVPMRFSKIIIPRNGKVELYEAGFEGDKGEYRKVLWKTEINNLPHMDPPATDEYRLHPIQYDMMVYGDKGTNGTYTQMKTDPYTVNRCEEVHFEPNAEMMHAELLHPEYQKAWVDYELAPNRWYTLASPLQGIVAGDWYVPSANYRQETEYYQPITFKTNRHNRFNPAVFQRGWDEGNTAIRYDNNVSGRTQNTITANWSIVYNDVTVPYTPGQGFSLKVVPKNTMTGNTLFRLPKADTEYSYYHTNGTTDHTVTIAEDSRRNAGRLIDKQESFSVSITNQAVNNPYFLVGNPFIAHLDMKKFFEANGNVEKKYWIVKEDNQQVAIANSDGQWISTEEEGTTAHLIAPLQSFFVKRSEGQAASTTLELSFTNEMQALDDANSSLLRSSGEPTLSLTARRGDTYSRAIVAARVAATPGFKADEDAELLLDNSLQGVPAIYTVAGNQTATINASNSLANIPFGVYSPDDGDVTVTISGQKAFGTLVEVYDAVTRTSLPLNGNETEITVKGNVHGRYFLRSDFIPTGMEKIKIEEAGISIYSALPGQVFVSALRPVKEIKVFGLNGSLVRRFSVNTEQYSFNLPAGIYMIYASDGEREHTEKVIVR